MSYWDLNKNTHITEIYPTKSPNIDWRNRWLTYGYGRYFLQALKGMVHLVPNLKYYHMHMPYHRIYPARRHHHKWSGDGDVYSKHTTFHPPHEPPGVHLQYFQQHSRGKLGKKRNHEIHHISRTNPKRSCLEHKPDTHTLTHIMHHKHR